MTIPLNDDTKATFLNILRELRRSLPNSGADDIANCNSSFNIPLMDDCSCKATIHNTAISAETSLAQALSSQRIIDRWEKVAQQGGGYAWIATYPVGAGIEDLELAVYEFDGCWVFDIDHPDMGELLSGERRDRAEAMAAALDAAPQVARGVEAEFSENQGNDHDQTSNR